MKTVFQLLIIATLVVSDLSIQLFAQVKPVRIAIAGMTHGHVGWILNREDIGDIEVVGLAEPNVDLANRLISRSNLDQSIWFQDLDEMLMKVGIILVTNWVNSVPKCDF